MKLVIPGIFLLSLTHALQFPPSAENRRMRHLGTAPRAGRDAALQAVPLDNTCNDKALDLVFIIDSSRSVSPYDYEKVKEFIVTILKFLDIGPDNTRVGLLQYASTIKQEFSLKTFRKKSDVDWAVQRMRALATGTMTGLAIQYAMNIAFSEAEGARPLDQNVPRVAMIVTDGRPQDPVAEIAAKARNSGILIFAVGVGEVDMNTLKSIGSDPHEEHVFLVANFSQIESLTSIFQQKLCVTHLCATVAHGCAHVCINSPGSYSCKCKAGYLLNPDQKTCSTQDLCALENHDCEQICVNTPGSYVCQCYEGYELADNGKACIVVDFCATGNHLCQHECVNNEDSYICECHKGFLLNEDQKSCRRLDYCTLPDHGCQHECVNGDESYFCRCHQGFTLNEDKKTCRRINYCAQGKHGCAHECVNKGGSYICKCRTGHTLNPDGKTCRVINYCSLGKHGCEHECQNTKGSYICKCRTGHILNPDGKTCRGVDHCAESSHGCEQLCLNTVESYICQCSEGFVINDDLQTCSRVDYCALTDHGCEHVCANSEESYKCLCLKGYQLQEDGKSCKRMDYCAQMGHGCDHLCTNSEESYKCLCHEGYQLQEDGKSCKRVDYCALVDHGCEHVCANREESYKCLCLKGYQLQDDGKSCKKVNYCALTDHSCEHLCVNSEESYKCLCLKGYQLQDDGKSCNRMDYCALEDHSCEHVCSNSEESYKCLCLKGYQLQEDGKSCKRVDYCALIDHGCEHLCTNIEESYKCLCHEGYQLQEDGKSCKSIDFCKSTDHGCDHICVNNENSYICACLEGYTLKEDGRQCRRCTEGPIDLVFVIDGSKSLGEDNFEIVKQFVNGIIDSLEIAPKAAHVGLVQYSTRVRTEFTLGQHSSAYEMKKAVSQMKYMGKGSMTGLALKHMFYKSFSEMEGARASTFQVPRVAIVFTDGRAQDDVSDWANKAKHHGIIIYAIGVGKAIEEELREIASLPEDRHLFYTEDFSSMGDITEKLKSSICEGWAKRRHRLEVPMLDVAEKFTLTVTDSSAPHSTCSIPVIHFKALLEENQVDKKDEDCKCKNIMELQNHAHEDVRKLTEQLEEITRRMAALENRVR